jgi:hypothetical protein
MTPREKELVNIIHDLANRMIRHINTEIDPNTKRMELHDARRKLKKDLSETLEDIRIRSETAKQVVRWEEDKEASNAKKTTV